jgi:hypothetical protein
MLIMLMTIIMDLQSDFSPDPSIKPTHMTIPTCSSHSQLQLRLNELPDFLSGKGENPILLESSLQPII